MIKTLDTEPSVDLETNLTKDKMEAFLFVKKKLGKKYALIDCKPMQKVKVIARCVIEEEPAPIRYEDVMEALQNKGVVFGIQEDAIMKAVQDTAGEITVKIATGLPPVESADASIMYNFQDEDWSVTAKNPYGDGKIHSVSVGEIVAIKRPPDPGEPGIDVTGEPVSGVRLQKGDIVLFYTDGLTEALNSAQKQLGIEKLAELLNSNALYDASQIIDRLIVDLGQFIGDYHQTDDITLVVLKVEQ